LISQIVYYYYFDRFGLLIDLVFPLDDELGHVSLAVLVEEVTGAWQHLGHAQAFGHAIDQAFEQADQKWIVETDQLGFAVIAGEFGHGRWFKLIPFGHVE
jgi:hypothetical protein